MVFGGTQKIPNRREQLEDDVLLDVIAVLKDEIKRLREDNQKLLDRLMSMDFSTYKSFEQRPADAVSPYSYGPEQFSQLVGYEDAGEIIDETPQNDIA